MFNFDSVTIDHLDKTDFLAIIQALDYTYENTKIQQFKDLKNSIMENMCELADIESQDELIDFLVKSSNY